MKLTHKLRDIDRWCEYGTLLYWCMFNWMPAPQNQMVSNQQTKRVERRVIGYIQTH